MIYIATSFVYLPFLFRFLFRDLPALPAYARSPRLVLLVWEIGGSVPFIAARAAEVQGCRHCTSFSLAASIVALTAASPGLSVGSSQ